MQINFLSYLLAAILSYLGLLIGIILIKMAPEEQKPGRKHFILLKNILFFFIIALVLLYYGVNAILSLALLYFIFVLLVKKILYLEKSTIVYLLFGFIFYFSSKMFDLFILESALIFLYGIPNSSLMINPKKNNYNGIFIKNLWFFLPAIILYILF